MKKVISIIALAMLTAATDAVNAQTNQSKTGSSQETFLYTTSSLLDLMTWDATTNMDLINQPLLMITCSKADTKYMTDEAFPKAINAKNKKLFVIDGATHIQTYWKPEYVSQAVNKLLDFYQTNLYD